ncbi:hypothetical protein ACIRL2_20280, partial [Embleya sp. NPDC127516]|uniref:hypothetical protein n=1 Tax=Embleya sp. NPDC127516 TaxID=3363990 RepID=UPI00381465D6
HSSGEYTAHDAHGSGEYTAYGAETYPQVSHPPAEHESGGYAAVSPSGDSGGHAAVSPPSEPDPYSPDPNRGASAYDPALDPALGPALPDGRTTGSAATAGRPKADEPKASEASEASAGPRAAEAPDPDTGMRPPPPPHEGDIIKLVGVGSLIWFALFVAAWLMRDTLEDDGRGWWPWCALAGSGLGLFGLWYCRRLQSARED